MLRPACDDQLDVGILADVGQVSRVRGNHDLAFIGLQLGIARRGIRGDGEDQVIDLAACRRNSPRWP